MRQFIACSILFALCLLGSPAFAFNCNAIVNDDGHVFTDVAKVEAAARALGNSGADVKVVTYDSVPSGKTIANLIDENRSSCPTWQNSSRFKNNLFVLAFARPSTVDARFGIDFEPTLGHKKWQDAAKPALIPAITKFKAGDKDAMTVGFVKTLAAYDGMLSRPVGATGPVTIYQASDNSGFTKVLWGGLILIALGLGAVFFLRNRGDGDKRKAAQAEAKRVRSICVSGLNDLNSSRTLALYDAKASNNDAIKDLVDRYRELASGGLQTLSRFDNAAGEDPNDANLTVDVYNSNRSRYASIIETYIEPAKDVARQIEAGRPDAPKQAPPATPAPTVTPTPPQASVQPASDPVTS